MKYIRLGDLLLRSGAITEEQLSEALALQKEKRERLGTVLIENGIIKESQLIEALTTQLGVEYIDLNSYEIPADMARLLPRSIAKKYQVVPVKATRTDVFLAMADPLNFVAIEEVAAATRRHVVPMITTMAAVNRAVLNLYSNQGAARAIEEMRRDMLGNQSAGSLAAAAAEKLVVDDENGDAAPAIRLVNSIIERAYTEKASDIHLEPGEELMNIRMRIDGLLHPIINVPRELENSVISRLKIMCHMDIAQRNLPQDGHASITIRQESIDLRASTLPTIYGEKMVLRLLRKMPELVTMEGIGLRGENRERFLQLLNSTREGAILMVGPTGSGKTSTMYTIIDHLKGESKNLISLEDPVEYHMDHVCQVQINEKVGLTFASALRAVLRQDPDIIAVGEIRDGETAEIAMRSAITGHMVLSTIHTNDAVSSIDRLMDIGVEPYVLSGAVKGIVSQRLLRRICPHCRKSYKPGAEELRLMGFPEDSEKEFFKGEGCDDCFHTGYRGRIGVFEILPITAALRRAIYKNDRKAMEEAMENSDFRPLMENCRELILDGITTAEEVERVVEFQEKPAKEKESFSWRDYHFFDDAPPGQE